MREEIQRHLNHARSTGVPQARKVDPVTGVTVAEVWEATTELGQVGTYIFRFDPETGEPVRLDIESPSMSMTMKTGG